MERTDGITTLYDTTRDLHHACEMHPVGGAMSDGSIHEQWWADWLLALYQFHSIIDHSAHDNSLARVDELCVDIKGCSREPRFNAMADELTARFTNSESLREAGRYVLTGAHLMGGAVTKKRIGYRLPTAHLQFGNRKLLMKEWKPYRYRTELTNEARLIFQYLLWTMDEILLNDIGTSYSMLEEGVS